MDVLLLCQLSIVVIVVAAWMSYGCWHGCPMAAGMDVLWLNSMDVLWLNSMCVPLIFFAAPPQISYIAGYRKQV